MYHCSFFIFMLLSVTDLIYGGVIPESLGEDWRLKDLKKDYVLVQGDIAVPKNSITEKRDEVTLEKRKSTDYTWKMWPKGVVPYQFSVSWTWEQRQKWDAAIADYHQHTCLTFVPRTGYHKHWLSIGSSDGCWSYIGMSWNEGEQMVSLPGVCIYKATIIHELGHAIGFNHEQQRSDRDNYVAILTQNVSPAMLSNFEKAEDKNYGIPYDYKSVMHYGKTSFSMTGAMTIYTRNEAYQDIIGQAESLSFLDAKMANLMYNCSDHCEAKTCPDGGFLDKSCECLCAGDPIRKCSDKPTPAPSVKPTEPPANKKCVHFNENLQGRVNNNIRGDNFKTWDDCAYFCRYSVDDCTQWVWHNEHMGQYAFRCVTMQGFSNTAPQMGVIWGSLSCDDDDNIVCEDNNDNCAAWAQSGECDINAWMLDNCKKSCKICNGGGGTNLITEGKDTKCSKIGQNLQGRKNAKVWDNFAAWDNCQHLCKFQDNCNYWVWHDGTMGAYKNKCVTMESYTNVVNQAGMVWGSWPC